MVTIEQANKVMKDIYLDVITSQLNYKTNAFYNMIRMGSEDVEGYTVVSPGKYGINGGMGSGEENSTLPQAGSNNYIKLRADLRNIFGTIEISDKVLRASSSSAGAMVNVLNSEMEGLLDAAKFNFSRMLFQNGSGELCKIADMTEVTSDRNFPVKSLKNVIEGMIVDIIDPGAGTKKATGCKIIAIDRANNVIKLDKDASITPEEDDCVCLQQSYDSEIFGLPYIFDSSLSTMYGLVRCVSEFLLPTSKTAASISSDLIQETLDDIEERSGNDINLLICSYDVRRDYFAHLASTRMNIDYMNLDGGFKALSYNGIPMVADRFCQDKKMFFVNTDDYKLQQLNDWSWLEGQNGKVLRQVENKPAYTATLVKYANLMCVKPVGQGQITFS